MFSSNGGFSLDFQQQGQRRGSLKGSLFRDASRKKTTDDTPNKGLFKTRKSTDEQINPIEGDESGNSDAETIPVKTELLENRELNSEEPTVKLTDSAEKMEKSKEKEGKSGDSQTEFAEDQESTEKQEQDPGEEKVKETEEKIKNVRVDIPPPKKPVNSVEQTARELLIDVPDNSPKEDRIIEKTLEAIMSSSASRRKLPERKSILKSEKLIKSKKSELSDPKEKHREKSRKSAKADDSEQSNLSGETEKRANQVKPEESSVSGKYAGKASAQGVTGKEGTQDMPGNQQDPSQTEQEQSKETTLLRNTDPDEVVKRKKALPYDWGRTTKFSADQKKFLERVFNQFADFVMTKVAPLIQTRFTLEYQSAKLRPYGNFTQSLYEPIVLIISRMDPEHQGLLVVDFPLSFALIDRCLGGKGEPLDEIRYFTEIETTIFERIAKKLTESYQEAWREIKECKPHLVCMEFNPQMVHIVKPSDLMVCITFEARVANTQGPLYVALPYDYLKSVLPKANFEEFMLTRNTQIPASPTVAPLFAKNLEQAKVPVSIDLGETELMFQELILLEVGDFITLDQELNKPLKIRVNEKVKFLGRPGVRDNKLSVQVTKVLQEGDEEFEE
jgi:flagellar motor switch protein FliM